MAKTTTLYPRYSKNYILLFVTLGLLQVAIWWQGLEIRPNFEVVPVLTSKNAVQALSLGDEQGYFRMMAFNLQNLGDGVGRVTPLYRYNYALIKDWAYMLDALDPHSDFVPAVMSFYYSQTQFTPDVRHIVEYLDAHSENRVNDKWEWVAQAVYLANHRLEDKDLALKLAEKLATSTNPSTPMWARQMPAFIHEQRGELEQAEVIIRDLMQRESIMTASEKSFMQYFLKYRIEALQAENKLPK